MAALEEVPGAAAGRRYVTDAVRHSLRSGDLVPGHRRGHRDHSGRRRQAAARHTSVGEEALTARRTFHQTLYRASHNDVLIGLLDDLWDKSGRYRRLGLELPPGDEPRTRDLQEHHQLVDLIEAGRLLRDHVAHSLTATAISALEDREGAHPA
ncbi:FCD domain-containing protein [Streptomyces sp. NPDC000351]|uniref:FCD domain-containing protein n=1 Tax=Streptomyces sp. NPDC000351 TaxID=3154250 RepID=UPI00332CDCC1